MKFFAVAAALSMVSCAVADYNTVVADIGVISKRLTALNTSVTAYTGGEAQTFAALAIQGQATDLQKAIDKAAKDAKASPAFGDDGSNAVANAVLALEPDIFSTLDNLVRKKPEFSKPVIFGIKPTALVLPDLKNLKASTNTLGKNIIAKLNSVFAGVAPTIIADINTHFDDAIKVYSS